MTGGLVAVAFSDVVSSTELWSTLGDARADALRRRLRDASVESLAASGGVVVKDTGDGLMVTFATASASIDGAVALQRAASAVARATGVSELRIRVGVSIGEATADGGDWFGVPVVEAARLCAAADPGQILVNGAVLLLARRSDHAARALGERTLKGLAEPVAVSEIEWSPAVVSAVPLPQVLRRQRGALPFAGRQPALAALRQALDRCREQHLVFVSGEPGVGKTRILSEFCEQAAATGVTIVGSSFDQEADSSWRTLLAGLRTLTGHHEPTAEIRRVLSPLIVGVEPTDDGLAAGDADAALIADRVAQWLEMVTDAAPVIWVVDDLHWASLGSLHVLRNLLSALGELPVLIIGAYRDTDLDRTHPLSGWLAEVRRHGPLVRLDLQGLSVEDTCALMSARAGGALDDAARALAHDIHRETDGNAFFIGQVIEHLAETGVARVEDQRWLVDADYAAVGLPQGVREVVGNRLARLPPGVGEVLAVAAIHGREFTVPVVAGAIDVDLDQVVDALDLAEQAGLIEAQGAIGHFRFVHALVRQTVIEELSSLRRCRLHLSVAQAIDRLQRGSVGEQTLDAIGHYLEAGVLGGLPRAIELIAAVDVLAHPHVFELALRALADAGHIDVTDDARARMHIVIAQSAWVVLNDRSVTERSFVEAVRLAELVGDPELFAEAVASGSNAAGFGMHPLFLELAPRALENVSPTSTVGLGLRWAINWGRCLFAPPGVDAAADFRQLAAAGTALPVTMTHLTSAALRMAGLALHSSPDVSLALEDRARGRGAQALGASWALARVDLAAHRELCAEELARSESAGVAATRPSMYQALALNALARGDLDAAWQLIDDVERTSLGEPMFAHGIPLQRSVVVQWRGLYGQAIAIEEGLRAFTPYPRMAAANLAVLHADAGDLAAAAVEFRLAWNRGPDDVGRDWAYTGTISALAEAATRLDLVTEANVLDEILAPFDGQFLLSMCHQLRGSVSWLRAGLARCMGQLDEAILRYERAESFEREQGADLLLACTRVDLAGVLAGRGYSGDADRARHLLAAATEAAAAMGAGRVLQRAAVVRQRFG